MKKTQLTVTSPLLPNLNEFGELLKEIWDSKWITNNGSFHQQLEAALCEYLKVPYISLFTNGTLPLLTALQALRITGEVITTPYSFVATTHSIWWNGCKPVFVDIEEGSCGMDPNRIEAAITPRTTAIMPVHCYGKPCNMERIQAIADKYNLKVIYDACHSVGVYYKGQSIFNYGNISVTSFHATKMLNTTEGGGCFTLNKELDEKLRRIRFFGFENHADIVEDGTNGKMTEVHAAVGLANLKYLDAALADRKKKYAMYKDALSRNGSLSFQKINEGCNYSYFPVIFPTEDDCLKVIAALNEQQIFPRRYFYPSVNTFTKLVPYVSMPISEDIASRILCLPLYYTLSKEDMERIINIIIKTIQ